MSELSVSSVAHDVQFVAEDAGQMKLAQEKLGQWFRAKVDIAVGDAADLRESLKIATDAGLKVNALKRQCRIADQKVLFYRKCLAAVEAGYSIVPNMPGDLFAVRIVRESPVPMRSQSEWRSREQRGQPLEIGEGSYRDSAPLERKVSHQGHDPKTGELRTIDEWEASAWDEVEFPISLAKPAVLSATQRAMALRLFDELSIVPGRRSKGDPIVLGHVMQPWKQTHVSFLVVWWFDTRDL